MKTIKIIIVLELIVFAAGLVFGVTGSSLGLNRQFECGLKMDEYKILGSYRPIRSDEWAVATLLAIAQYNNKDKFPQLNENMGVNGKKLAIAHDTGVPVKEASLLGKPATWGFFLFDLRHALSWYWLFPLFIAINGVWFLLNMIWQKQPLANFCFSLYLAFSYHSAAWSFWPAWQIGLSCLSAALFLFILKNQGMKLNFLASLALGVFLASTMLTIYYPRLIPIITCILLLLVAVCIHQKLFPDIYEKKWYLLFAALVTITIGVSWYLSNADAISAILSSTYPGQRRNYGGGQSLFRSFSGWLEPILVFNTYGYSNISEMATFYSFILAIIPLLFLSKLRKDIIITIMMIYLIFTYCYVYIGIPEWLGQLTFWNRTVPRRAIIGIELSQIFIFAWFYSKKDEMVYHKYFLWASLLIPVLIFVILALSIPPQMVKPLRDMNARMVLSLGFCFISLCLAYYVFMNRIKFFPYVLLIITLPITFFWNPICIAPSSFSVELPFDIAKDTDKKYDGRILAAVDNGVKANILAASGLKVLNVTSHYTDEDIYENFYKNIDKGAFKKYHHMLVSLDENNKNDIVSVINQIWFKLNNTYDFSRFKADYMVTKKPPTFFSGNKSVVFIAETGDDFWYKILHEQS